MADTPRSSLTLAAADGLPTEHLVENWRRALLPLDATPEQVALMSQVHGARVVEVQAGTGVTHTAGEADALITDRPGVVLAVRVADCVPLLMTDGHWIGAVHAGWRGVAQGILASTVQALRERGAGPLQVVIGPHISQAAFQVGPEVVRGIEATGVPEERFAVHDVVVDGVPRFRVDLQAALMAQAEALEAVRIESVARCTTDPDLFSYRHDGPHTGRMAGLVVRTV